QPSLLTVHDGHFELTETTPLRAPAPLADLVRELLGPPTGFGLPEGDGGIELVESVGADLGPEGYRLSVTPDGIRATGTEAGLRWAVQTLRQLLPVAVFGTAPHADAQWIVPCVDIVDTPHYPWRGALLDVARWCHPIGFLYRFVDTMAVHK